MKIAVWHNLPSGGGKRALYYHVRGLVERGHEITCWSLDTADHSYLPLSEFASEHVVACRSRNGSRKRIAGDSAAYYRAIDEMRAFDEASRGEIGCYRNGSGRGCGTRRPEHLTA